MSLIYFINHDYNENIDNRTIRVQGKNRTLDLNEILITKFRYATCTQYVEEQNHKHIINKTPISLSPTVTL